MKLSSLEEDLAGDLAQDDHGLWELFQVVRLHSPSLADAQVLERGRDLIATWSVRGWLEAVDSSGKPVQVSSLVTLVDQLGPQALQPSPTSPWIRLSKAAHDAIPWLR